MAALVATGLATTFWAFLLYLFLLGDLGLDLSQTAGHPLSYVSGPTLLSSESGGDYQFSVSFLMALVLLFSGQAVFAAAMSSGRRGVAAIISFGQLIGAAACLWEWSGVFLFPITGFETLRTPFTEVILFFQLLLFIYATFLASREKEFTNKQETYSPLLALVDVVVIQIVYFVLVGLALIALRLYKPPFNVSLLRSGKELSLWMAVIPVAGFLLTLFVANFLDIGLSLFGVRLCPIGRILRPIALVLSVAIAAGQWTWVILYHWENLLGFLGRDNRLLFWVLGDCVILGLLFFYFRMRGQLRQAASVGMGAPKLGGAKKSRVSGTALFLGAFLAAAAACYWAFLGAREGDRPKLYVARDVAQDYSLVILPRQLLRWLSLQGDGECTYCGWAEPTGRAGGVELRCKGHGGLFLFAWGRRGADAAFEPASSRGCAVVGAGGCSAVPCALLEKMAFLASSTRRTQASYRFGAVERVWSERAPFRLRFVVDPLSETLLCEFEVEKGCVVGHGGVVAKDTWADRQMIVVREHEPVLALRRVEGRIFSLRYKVPKNKPLYEIEAFEVNELQGDSWSLVERLPLPRANVPLAVRFTLPEVADFLPLEQVVVLRNPASPVFWSEFVVIDFKRSQVMIAPRSGADAFLIANKALAAMEAQLRDTLRVVYLTRNDKPK
ncbi:MAG: hypothetical protein ACP5R4_12535 [Armatimonadota bacterium]